MKPNLKTRGEGIQGSIFRHVKFTHEDFPTADAVLAFQVPGDAIPIGGFLAIESAFDALATISVGNGTIADLYLAATSATALAKTALDADWLNGGKPLGAKKTVYLKPSAAMTQGEGHLVLEYIRMNRNHSTEG